MCKFADCEDTNTRCIPALGWDIGGLGEPDRFPGIEAPYSGAVKDGGIFTTLGSVIATNAYTGPFVGGVFVEGGKNISELGVKDFLETDEGSGDVTRVDFESGDNQRQPGGPCFFAAERAGGSIPDVVGEEANGDSW